MATTIIINQSDVETSQPVSVADIVNTISSKRQAWTLARIYRRQLRLYRRMAQFIDRHPVLSNLWIGGWSVMGILYIFLYC